MAQEAAAREAAARAESAAKEAESLVNARREAELAKLRLAAQPSIRSLALVGPEHLPAAVAFACGAAAAAGGGGKENGAVLRLDDRSWWRMLHFLEAEVHPAQFCGAQFCGAQFLGAILSLTRRHRPSSFTGPRAAAEGGALGQRALPLPPRRQ